MATLALLVPVRSTEKHPSNPLAIEQRFLNFGALAVATHCENRGHSARVFDEYVLSDNDFCLELAGHFGEQGPDSIGLSCISAYSADRARQVVKDLKQAFPNTLLLVGGQHFAGFWQERFSAKMPGVDVLIAGEAEIATCQVLDLLDRDLRPHKWTANDLPGNVWYTVDGIVSNGKGKPSVVNMDEIVNAQYDLYPGSLKLFPSIEFSRGCKYACVFCANTSANRRNFRKASSHVLKSAIENLSLKSGRDPIAFYMQASDFFMNEDEAELFAETLGTMPCNARWRTEIRVDEMNHRGLRALKSSGLSYLDIGLESASKSILRVMNKTPRPETYLQRANDLLEAAKDLGIFTKVNYLIHPGDTPETVEESKAWLFQRKSIIDGISSGVALEYPGTPLSERLGEFMSRHGTKRRQHELSEWGVYNLDPSSTLSYERAEEIACSISQRMQTRSDFIRSKAFGYLGSDADPEELLLDLPDADHSTPYG